MRYGKPAAAGLLRRQAIWDVLRVWATRLSGSLASSTQCQDKVPNRCKRSRLRCAAAIAVWLLCGPGTPLPSRAVEVEVLHWWTSGSEAKSVTELKRMLGDKGVTWRDFAVTGGGGDAAKSALRARVDEGNPPTAAQLKAPEIQEWGRRGQLANLDDVAAAGNWDARLPAAVAAQMKVDGHWAAVPVDVHRVNWLWINKDVLRKVGGRIPASWDQFFALAERFKAVGIVPVAHGGQPWQDLTLFEVVVLGVGGPDLYRRAFVSMEPASWSSQTMTRAITTFRRIKPYTDVASAGRDWNTATGMVVRGEAGMQIMGDWAKGEFLLSGKKPDIDFVCTAAPGTWEAYIYNVDSFAMFRLQDPKIIAGQKTLAATIMGSAFQEIFNREKGSIPAIYGVDMRSFDSCAHQSSGYFIASSLAGSLVPSFAHDMANSKRRVQGVQAIVARMWDDEGYPTATAQADLATFAATR